jgi:hypothetical protein
VVDITALSHYLFGDLNEHFERNPMFFNDHPFNFSFEKRDDRDGSQLSRSYGRSQVGYHWAALLPSGTSAAPDVKPMGDVRGRYDGGEPPTVIPNCRYFDGAPVGVLNRRAGESGYIAIGGEHWASYAVAQCADPVHAAALSIMKSIPKKFRDQTSRDAEDKAHQKFLAINQRCQEWVLNLQFSWEEELFGLFRKELDDFFHPGGEPLIPNEHAIFDRGRCGPGASLGANGVDFYTKLFSSNLTATSLEVYYQYAGWCAVDPKWRDAEFNRLTSFGLPSIIHESRVTFVPKNRDTLRTICTEPNLNMFAQLGVGAILEDRLRSFYGIDLSVQPDRNAELARLGSIAGAIDTIDLESASDSMSLGMLEASLPDWVFETLLWYRCPRTIVRGEQVKLNMISTMGNGYTFPLQTLIFTCAVQAVAKQCNASMRRADLSWSPWGVFGDDIAVPSFMTARLIRLLNILGFQVNREKSFTDKYLTFRESCGYDYFLGHNIRGVYIKSLKTPQSRYIAINLLNEWSARWGIPLRRSIGYLRDSVRVLAIPPWVGVDSGIRVPLNALYSGHLHVYRSSRWRYSYLFRCYEAVVPSLKVLDDSIAIPRNLNRVPRRMYSPSGLLIAAIGGYLRGGRIPLALKQGETPCYRMRTGVSPFWGPTVEQISAQGSGFWERWNNATLDNLGF